MQGVDERQAASPCLLYTAVDRHVRCMPCLAVYTWSSVRVGLWQPHLNEHHRSTTAAQAIIRLPSFCALENVPGGWAKQKKEKGKAPSTRHNCYHCCYSSFTLGLKAKLSCSPTFFSLLLLLLPPPTSCSRTAVSLVVSQSLFVIQSINLSYVVIIF